MEVIIMLNLVPYRKHNDLYNPFHELEEFERSLFAPDTLASFRTDIEDAGDKLVLSADLPGFQKEDIHVDIDSDRLTINAERHSNYEKKDNRGNYLRCERSYGSYSRTFSLDGIDADNISASYENGVLKLDLPKQQVTKPDCRRLEIH